MRALVLTLLAAVCVCAEALESEMSGAVGLSRSLGKRRNTKSKEALTAYTKEVYEDMREFLRRLRKSGKLIEEELTLTEEQKEEISQTLKLFTRESARDGTPLHRGSILDVNKKSGVAHILFQGDMVLSKEQQEQVLVDVRSSRSKRQAYNDETYPGRRWSEGVFYSLDGNLPNETKTNFKKAAQMWMENTCINFTENEDLEAKDVILVYSEHGCWSEVGRQGELQLISLGDGCEQIGTAAHEIGHALGLWHTHTRHDRDRFITVIRENIDQKTYIEQFTKETKKTNNNYNLTYDYGSIMHYGARSGATDKAEKDGNLTVIPKIAKYTETLGSHIIAFYDLLMINTYYNCTDLCNGATTECYNGGFAHPRNCSKCICPSGYGGKFCNKRPRGCGAVLKARRQWKMFEGSLNGSKVGLDGYRRCSYWIKAPTGKKIKVKVVEVPNVPTDGCIYAGVEIKTHRDQRRTGYRFCSKTYLGTKFESNSNVVPVIVYEHEDLGKDGQQPDDYSYTDEDDTSDEDSEEEIEGEEIGDGDIEEEDASEHDESLTTGTKLLYRYV